MAIFRLQEHSPDVYPRKSRDYQLFSVLFDCLNGGIKHDINSIRDILDTNQINENLIPYLQTKLGFFTKIKIPTDKLRIILKAFPTIVKNKGSKKGIEQAIEVFLKVEKISAKMGVTIINKAENAKDSYTILISTSKKIDNYDILKEILRYVLPAGYILKFVYAPEAGAINDRVVYMDAIEIAAADPFLSRGVRNTDENTNIPNLYNTVGLTTVSSNDLKKHEPNKYKLVDKKSWEREDLWD